MATHLTSLESAVDVPANGLRLKHIRELDGVRGLAALFVFIHHTCYAEFPDRHWTGAAGILMHIAIPLDSGVDLFFVLSGFLISSILLEERKSPRYYQDFYWKRALRILPLYLTILTIVFCLQRNVPALILCLTFMANFAIPFKIADMGPFWSLAIEEQFYLLWPTLVRRRDPVKLTRWAIALVALPMLGRLIAAHFGHHDYRISFFRVDSLAWGALIACAYKRGFFSNRRDTLRIWIISGLFVSIGLFSLYDIREFILHIPNSNALSADMYQTGYGMTCATAIAAVIFCTGSPLLGFLRSRVLVFFGLISYAFYMVHIYVVENYYRFFGHPAVNDDKALAISVVVTFSISLALALISRYLIELPAMSLRKRVLSHPAPHPEQQDPPLPLANM